MKGGGSFESESEMATALMDDLGGLGWDCYPEAKVQAGGRADIAAVFNGKLLWIIEAKQSFNAVVVEQAWSWLRTAHFVSVLVPRYRPNRVLEAFCRDRGIGVVQAYRGASWRGTEHIEFTSHVMPRPNRRADAKRFIAHLHPDMKRYAPGTNGSYSSPWRRTMDAAVAQIARHPGVGVKDVVASIAHHYGSDSTARSCLRDWLMKDARVRVEIEGRAIRFYPKEAA